MSAPEGLPGKIDPRAVQGLIDICMRYYPQLSTLEQMGVEQVAAQLEQHRQRQMLAGLPGLQAEGGEDNESVPAPHPDAGDSAKRSPQRVPGAGVVGWVT